MKKLRKLMSLLLAVLLIVTTMAPLAYAETETLPNGYQIDMDDLPKVHFGEHPEWEELFDATWEMHKSNIQKIPAVVNPEEPYYVDEAFSGNIFAWDTMFMMMYDKFGINQFPTLASMDNFYWNQVDDEGAENDGYIPREIIESSGKDYHNGYTDERSMNPPLWAWAEWEQYQIHGDVSRFSKVIKGKTIFDRLVSHYNFIERYKKLDTGLYGKTNGLGNGLDNTPNQGSGQTYNDLSIQQAQFAYYIAKIAEEMGDTENAAFFHAEHQRISALINEKLWSEEAQMYSNLAADGVTKTNISTPTNLWALAGHVTTPERAAAIIQQHGLNSNKLFRPNGLATTSYDYSTFHPEGGYWLGAIWAPTSYQYIKGLSEAGYEDLAFEEALRHLKTTSAVYEAGKEGGYVTQSTIWENYSSEYIRNGYTGTSRSSRPNFAGWTGCLAIGVILEDVLGLDVNAPDNTVMWNIRLTEEHGVSNLYFCHNGVENRVSLLAENRNSGNDPVNITVTADQDFTLVVKNNGQERILDIKAGTQTYTIAGEAGEEGYIGAISYPLSEVADQLTKAELDQNAVDYVVFGAEEDSSITDGIRNQIGKAGSFYNVNTVGHPTKGGANPMTIRSSGDMQALGFADAQEVVKQYHSYGSEGFMAMVPAGNSMQTLRVIVGVQNARAKLTAALSDGSDADAVQELLGGDTEKVFVVDIPFRAASENRNVLIKWVIDSNYGGGNGKVSLKGLVLVNGGQKVPSTPGRPITTASDGKLMIDASYPTGETYDSWKIYVGTSSDNLNQVYETTEMPYEISGLDNYVKYYVAVSGIKDGFESGKSGVSSAMPEEEGIDDAQRAQKDLEATLPTILNGNTGNRTVRDFNLGAVGVLYGSTFTMVSSNEGQSNGVMNDGSVIRPFNNMPDKKASIVITAEYNGQMAEYKLDTTVKAIDTENDAYVVSTTNTKYTGKVFLTEEGTKDWVQVCSNIGGSEPQARKVNGSGIENLIRVHDAVPGGETGLITDSAFYYIASDAGQTAPRDRYGSHMRGEGNYLQFDLAYSEKPQRAYVYCGVWYAEARLDFIVNGEIITSETISAAALRAFRVGFDFKLASPTDKASVRLTLVDMNIVETNDNGSTYLNAITLQEIDSPLHRIPEVPVKEPIAYNQTTSTFSGTVNLTQEGNRDWFQLQEDTETNYARKAGGSGITNFKRNHDAVPDGEKGRVKDGNIYYQFTDADSRFGNPIDRSGMQTRGVGNGMEFQVGYSENMQTLKVYSGVWCAEAKVEFIVNNEIVYTTNISQNGGMGIFCTSIDYQLENPEDVAIFRLTLTNMTSYGSTKGSTFIFAAALSESQQEPEREIGTVVLAQHFANKLDAENPNIEDCGLGGKDVGGISADSWLTYNLDLETGGTYDLTLRYAARTATNPDLTILLDDMPIGRLTEIQPTGGWQTYDYVTVSGLRIPAGSHVLKLHYGNAGTNLHSFGLKLTDDWATIDAPQNVIKREEFEVSIHTPSDYRKLVLKNENDGGVSFKVLKKEQQDDGSFITVISLWLGTVGEERTLKFYDGDSKIGSTTLKVEPVRTGIISVSAPSSAKANEPFEVTVVTTKDLVKGNFYNDVDRGIGRTRVSRSIEGDYMTCVYQITVATSGENRSFLFKADRDKCNEYPYEYGFVVTITE